MAKYIDFALDAIKHLEKEVNTCNPNASLSIHIANKFLDDSFHEPEINYVEYENKRKIVDELATKFSEKCICLNKDSIGTELRDILKKYGYIK